MTQLASYTRFELLRTFRGRRFVVLSLGAPLVLYGVLALPERGVTDFAGTGLSAPLYLMIGLASFGAIASMLSSGTRIAGERAVGFIRQLRLTPLSARSYLRTKIITGYLTAGLTIGLLYLAGTVLGVRLPAETWLHMTQLLVIGLVPFAALGILLGHVLTVDSIGPATGATTAVFAIVSGSWAPLHGTVAVIAHYLPSYWLVQASRVALGGKGWPIEGWLVVAGWSAVLGALAAYAYRRDTQRV